jgi:L-iditol 2-dehydrogenase
VRVALYDMADPEFPVSLVDMDEPQLPGPSWARVAVELAGICGSDLHNVFPDGSGTRIFGPFVGAPMEMGHEVSGTIVEAGDECPLPVGTRVTVDPTLACAARGIDPCPMCVVGAYSSCHKLGSKIFTPGFGLGFTVGLGGAWSEQLVAHVSQLHALPDAVDLRTAVLTEPLSVSVHGILRRPPVDGEPVLVVGAGIIGLTALVSLRHLVPASEVTVLARHPHQADAARLLGAHHVVVPDAGYDYIATLAELGGGTVVGRKDSTLLIGGYRAVVEAVGTGASLSQAIRFVAQRGVVHFVGCAAVTTVDLAPAWFKEVDVVGTFCHAADWHDGELVHSFDRALAMMAGAMMAGGGPPLGSLVTHELPLADLRAACEVARDKSSGAIKVAVRP